MAINFNRLLNIKQYTRVVGGKLQRVGLHSKKAQVLRVRAALEDAAKNKVEVGYLVSKSGKLSQQVTQNSIKSVDYVFNGKRIPKNSPALATIHSHPATYPKLTTSPPSSADIRNTLSRSKNSKSPHYGYVVSSNDGSQFRYSQGPQYDKASDVMKHHLNRTVDKKIAAFEDAIGRNTKYSADIKFLIQDRFYQRLNQEGLLRYRVRPSDKLKTKRALVKNGADKFIDGIFKYD
jgi:hypothetical protein